MFLLHAKTGHGRLPFYLLQPNINRDHWVQTNYRLLQDTKYEYRNVSHYSAKHSRNPLLVGAPKAAQRRSERCAPFHSIAADSMALKYNTFDTVNCSQTPRYVKTEIRTTHIWIHRASWVTISVAYISIKLSLFICTYMCYYNWVCKV